MTKFIKILLKITDIKLLNISKSFLRLKIFLPTGHTRERHCSNIIRAKEEEAIHIF